MTRSVVITGVGAVTPLGVGARTLHERWTAGVSGIEDGYGRASVYQKFATNPRASAVNGWRSMFGCPPLHDQA